MPPKVAISDTLAEQIVESYKDGVSIVKTAQRFEVSPSAVRRTLVENDVELRGRGRYPGS